MAEHIARFGLIKDMKLGDTVIDPATNTKINGIGLDRGFFTEDTHNQKDFGWYFQRWNAIEERTDTFFLTKEEVDTIVEFMKTQS
jgi:hypothetical protein